MRALLPIFLFLLSPLLLSAASPEKVGFNRDVRAILSENCYYCHGPDEKHREEDLRLDIRADAIKAGAIVPGKPEESDLIARIFTDDEDEIMPPPKTHKILTTEQKELLKRWIAAGAQWPQNLTLQYKTPEQRQALAELQKKLPTLKNIQILPDKYSLETKRPVTLPLVRELLNQNQTLPL